jgi:cytochrome c-type biogenesis protein
MNLGLAGIFGAGLLTYATPCVLPLIPMYLAALAGGDLASISASRGRLLFRAAFFSLGFLIVFTALGLGASSVGSLLVEHRATVQILGGVLILLFGMRFLGFIQIPLLDRVLRGSDSRWSQRSGALGALMMGVVFAAGWSPCVGPVLGAVLTYTASTTSDPLVGAAYLAVYGAGFAVPLLLTAVFAGAGVRLLRRIGPWLPRIERALGAMLVVLAGTMLLGSSAAPNTQPAPALAADTRPRMVELFAQNCPICQQMENVVANVQKECTSRQVRIEQIDVSEPDKRHLVGEYRLVGVPTFVFLDPEDNEVARLVGRQSESTLLQTLSALVGEECSGVGPVPEADPAPPCVDDPMDPSENDVCRSTSTSVTPATRSSTTSGNTTNETSRPNARNAEKPATACSPVLLSVRAEGEGAEPLLPLPAAPSAVADACELPSG